MPRRRAALALALVPALASAAPAEGPFCSGPYADFLSSLRPQARAFEASPEAGYAYCIRTIATYEHLSYGRGGTVRRQYLRHVRHGTGFAYRAGGGEWYVATNQHVAEHPDVTETDADVDGVPAGSRKVREVVRIVRSESDDWDPGQIPLAPVVADAALDVAVLKTTHPLRVMPYRIGRSSRLRVGNAVLVRGYPLGAFAASNTGKVISVGQADTEHGWNHQDFAVDALLNVGNSGSPVLAVSCRTGELELVGVYHAGYRDAQGLNVVVAVDELRELLEELRVPHRARPPEDAAPDRAGALAALRASAAPFLMPFGDRVVRVEAAPAPLRFSLLATDFPLGEGTELALAADPGDPAKPGALVMPARFGEAALPWTALDAPVRDQARRLYDALWRQLADVLRYRREEARQAPEAGQEIEALAERIRGRADDQREILQSLDVQSDAIAWPASPPGRSPAPDRSPATPDRFTPSGVRNPARPGSRTVR